MKYIILKDGRSIEIDNTAYLIRDGVLYVYMATFNGYNYVRVGEVKVVVEQ